MKRPYKTVFAMGPSVPQSLLKNDPSYIISHTPTIRLTSLPLFTSSYRLKNRQYQSIIFTSKHAVHEAKRVFMKKRSIQLPRIIICVGRVTLQSCRLLYHRFCQRHKRKLHRLLRKGLLTENSLIPQFIVATKETQEGVVDVIKSNLSPYNGPLLWISSTHARSILREALTSLEYDLDILTLYTPVSQKISIRCQPEDTLFFSCPSSVHSFFTFSKNSTALEHSDCITIGPITEKALTFYLSKG